MIFAFKITPLHKKYGYSILITVVAILSLPNDEYFDGQSEYYKLFCVLYVILCDSYLYENHFYFMLYSLVKRAAIAALYSLILLNENSFIFYTLQINHIL